METNEPGGGKKGFFLSFLVKPIKGSGRIGRMRLVFNVFLAFVLLTVSVWIVFHWSTQEERRRKAAREWMYAVHINPMIFSNAGLEPNPNAPVPVKIGDLYGYRDRDGNMTIEPRFAFASDYNDGRASVAIDHNDYGYLMDHYRSAEAMMDAWNNNFEAGIIDETGNFVWSYPSLDAMPAYFSEGLARVCILGKYGFIDRQGNMVIKAQYDLAVVFREGRCLVKLKGKFGMIDMAGNYLIEPVLDHLGDFSEGLAAAELNGLYGYLDASWAWVIEPRFEDARSFSGGLAAAGIGGKYGYIDQAGNWVIEPLFDGADDFIDGTAVVWNGTTWAEQTAYRIDKAGNIVEDLSPAGTDSPSDP